MHDVVSDCNATAAAKSDKHTTRAVAIACTDDFPGIHLVDLYFLLCHSYHVTPPVHPDNTAPELW
jgi:hypothetical protein